MKTLIFEFSQNILGREQQINEGSRNVEKRNAYSWFLFRFAYEYWCQNVVRHDQGLMTSKMSYEKIQWMPWTQCGSYQRISEK